MKPLVQTIFTVISLLIVSGSCLAQYDSKNVSFGFTLSPSISWLGSKENAVESRGSRMGYNYGFMADIGFNDNYFLATGLTISQTAGTLAYNAGKGYTPSGEAPLAGGDYRIRMQHAVIPISLKLKTNEIKNLYYWGQFGTYLGVKLGARLYDGGQGLSKENITSAMAPVNMGLLIGGGVEFPISGNTRALAGLQFENGFIDATRDKKWQKDGTMVINNMVLRVGVFF